MARKNQYEIGVGMDTGPFEKSVSNGLVDPLEKAADAFEGLEDAAKSADLDKELDKAADRTNVLSKELDDARDGLKRLGYAARDAGDDAKRGMDGASEGAATLKDEAKQSARETAASFRDVTDVLDLVQEVAANALGGFGPAGVAAGLIAAAGIGLATGAFQQAEEAAEALRQKAVEYAQDAVGAGVSTDRWISSAETLIDRIKELEEGKTTDFRFFWQDDPSKLEDWIKAYERVGRTGDEVNDVLKLTGEGLGEYLAENKSALKDINDQLQTIRENEDYDTFATSEKVAKLRDQASAYEDIIAHTQEQVDLQEESAASAQRMKDAGIQSAQERAAAEEEAASRIQSAQESVEQSALSGYDTMRNAAYEKATADDAAFDVGKWLSYVEETRALADGYKANLATMKLSPAEWENFLALPEEARNSIAASYATVGEDGKARIQSALSDTGTAAGAEATVGFDDAFNPEASVDVDVQADTSDVDGALDAATEDRDVTVKANLTGEAAVRDGLDTLTKRRTVNLEAVLDLSQATRDLASWRRAEAAKVLTVTATLKKDGTWD